MNSRLQNLNKLSESLDSIVEKVDEESNVPRETEPKEENKEEPKKEDTEVSVTAVSVKTTSDEPVAKSDKSIYGTQEFVHYPDTHSKEVAPVPREMGSQDSIQTFEVSNAVPETTNPVPREMGSKDSVKDFKVTNTKMDHENPVPREMGSKDAPKKFLESYKTNIHNLLNEIKDSIKL